MQHIKSDDFNAYTPACQKSFEEAIDWLKEWACSRLFGLGTKLPWDEQFKIESLSDSTIYFAYYTINHLLHPNNLNGRNTEPDAINPDHMTHEVWDYIFKSKAYPENCQIEQGKLDEMRKEFEYWYPMDLRCSAKDLIKNHLSMSLYNHAAIWDDDEKKWPRGMFCNGYIMLNNAKMSKQTGNFLSLTESVQKYGSDACRIALADAGDSLEDANFVESVANAAVLKLFVFEKWIEEEFKKTDFTNVDVGNYGESFDTIDKIFDNELNRQIVDGQQQFSELKFKLALRTVWFELSSLKDDYVAMKSGKWHPQVLLKYVESQL